MGTSSIYWWGNNFGEIVPGLTKSFIKIFESWNTSNWTMFEWGSGGSTIWFAKRVNKIISVDNNLYYHNLVKEEIQHQNLFNVELLYLEAPSAYNGCILNYDKFDCILVDGRYRVPCVELALQKIKNEGVIILDDSQRERYEAAHQMLNKFEHFSTDLSGETFNDGQKTDYWIIKQ